MRHSINHNNRQNLSKFSIEERLVSSLKIFQMNLLLVDAQFTRENTNERNSHTVWLFLCFVWLIQNIEIWWFSKFDLARWNSKKDWPAQWHLKKNLSSPVIFWTIFDLPGVILKRIKLPISDGRKSWKLSATTSQLFSWGTRLIFSLR